MHMIPMWAFTAALAFLFWKLKHTALFALAASLTAVVMFTDVPWAHDAINSVVNWVQTAPNKL